MTERYDGNRIGRKPHREQRSFRCGFIVQMTGGL